MSLQTETPASESQNYGYFCKYNAPLCRPKTLQEFLNSVQNLHLVFVLNTAELLPEQKQVMRNLWVEIEQQQKIEFERQQAERAFWGAAHYER